MKISVKSQDPIHVTTERLVLLIPQIDSDPWRPTAKIAAVDRALGGQISALIASGDFCGKAGESLLLYPGARLAAKRIQLVAKRIQLIAKRIQLIAKRIQLIGLGDPLAIDTDTLRGAAGRAINTAGRHADIAICSPRNRKLHLADAIQALAEGATLAAYRFDTYRQNGEKSPAPAKTVSLLIDRPSELRAARAAARIGSVLAECQNLARQLSNEPPNALPPEQLARAAQRVAREVGLRAKVMKVAELQRQKMGGILAVGAGSANPPRLIVLDHDPHAAKGSRGKKNPRRKKTSARRLPTVCLIGKGITFDSGGISIKPSAAMDEMKHDMSGAAAVIGAMRACALLKLPIRVVGVIAAAENLPGSTAYRPGDIVTTMSKKTVEILNTDAEGRVVLADALHFARTQFEPDAMIDLATLTGACVVALGKWATGLFGNNDQLVEAVRRAGESSGERAWPMPLWEVHRKAVRSDVADIKNTTGRNASSSTAAAFLENFVAETPWIHLDIAGTAWGKQAIPYFEKGATGVGVRMLLELLRGWKQVRLV